MLYTIYYDILIILEWLTILGHPVHGVVHRSSVTVTMSTEDESFNVSDRRHDSSASLIQTQEVSVSVI